MKFPAVARWIALALALGLPGQAADRHPSLPEQWRQEHRIIDLHQHVNGTEEHVRRWLRIMDRVGVGVGVNLSGGTVTAKPGELSAFERTQALTERLAPGRAVLYFNLDYSGWDKPGFAERGIEQVNRAHALGAAGLKEYKRLGLFLRDQQGQLIRIDDPRLDGVWKRCGARLSIGSWKTRPSTAPGPPTPKTGCVARFRLAEDDAGRAVSEA